MKKIFLLLIFGFSLAFAKDQIFYHDIAEALNLKDASRYLDQNFKLDFSALDSNLTSISSKGKTTRHRDRDINNVVFDETYKKSCQYAFLDALRKLQKQARKGGYNSLINIHGNFKNQIYNSNEKFQCVVGVTTTSVFLRANLAKQ